MDISFLNNNTYIKKNDDFSVPETLECGQCFRFFKDSSGSYNVIAHNKILKIEEDENNIVLLDTSEDDFNSIWQNYFDLNRDYSEIKDKISKDDLILKDAIKYAPGIRILNQDFFECLISFIISQNNRIPMIKKVISNISREYGDKIGTVDGEDIYAFPTAEQLGFAEEAKLMELKTGFRAKYIIDAVKKFNDGEIVEEEVRKMDTESVRNLLMSIKGVGPKVSDCVLLFSLGRDEVFPVDVWVRRCMSYFYFENKDTPIKEIYLKAQQSFGNYAGLAQQYLFNYARNLNIGK